MSKFRRDGNPYVGMKVAGTEVFMSPTLSGYSAAVNGVVESAHIVCGNVTVLVSDMFAALLADRDNVELAKFIEAQANELRSLLADMESRLSVGGRHA